MRNGYDLQGLWNLAANVLNVLRLLLYAPDCPLQDNPAAMDGLCDKEAD